MAESGRIQFHIGPPTENICADIEALLFHIAIDPIQVVGHVGEHIDGTRRAETSAE